MSFFVTAIEQSYKVEEERLATMALASFYGARYEPKEFKTISRNKE